MTDNLIYIAKITKPHGVRGQAKLISYADVPEDIFTYPCLYDDKLNQYIIKSHSQNGNIFIISFNNNTSRNLVEEIAGLKLYITRDMMPNLSEEDVYHADLEGMNVLDSSLINRGSIVQIHNFGAGDIVEMKYLDKNDTVFLPFEAEFIIETDLKKRLFIFDFDKAGI